jgi:putative membrane protein
VSTLFAFLHHVAAFAFVAALVLEFILIRGDLTVQNARRILVADAVAGVAAGVVLAVGVLRVMYFEKGPVYYMHSAPFIAKGVLFVIVALLSIYPTITFLSWRKALAEGRAPAVEAGRLRRVRLMLHLELVGITLLILAAAMMARGVGLFG